MKRVSVFALLGPQVIGFTGVALFGRLADLVRPYLIARRVKVTVGISDCGLYGRADVRLWEQWR